MIEYSNNNNHHHQGMDTQHHWWKQMVVVCPMIAARSPRTPVVVGSLAPWRVCGTQSQQHPDQSTTVKVGRFDNRLKSSGVIIVLPSETAVDG